MRATSLIGIALAAIGVGAVQLGPTTEAPTGFDETNGHISQSAFLNVKAIFEEDETIEGGLGPTFNGDNCSGCHRNPTGNGSSTLEQRAGNFNGSVFTDHPGGSLVQRQAIDPALLETFVASDNVRALRATTGVLGDGFVEAMPDQAFTAIRSTQPLGFVGTIISVPVVEAGGTLRIGRFGWKNQHASLLSFSGDAYLNEMGITNLVNGRQTFARENTSNGRVIPRCAPGVFTGPCDPVADPEDEDNDVQAFADFMRATKAIPRGPINAEVTLGSDLFDQIGCAFCHTRNIATAAPGTVINGGTFTVSSALGNKVFHPFGDFMLHDVGTGDGIVQNGGPATRNMLRTPPLWGLRLRGVLMHDNMSPDLSAAILRHGGVGGTHSANRFRQLDPVQKAAMLAFLRSL